MNWLFGLKWDPCERQERREKGIFRAAHPHTPFLGQCPPPDQMSPHADEREVDTPIILKTNQVEFIGLLVHLIRMKCMVFCCFIIRKINRPWKKKRFLYTAPRRCELLWGLLLWQHCADAPVTWIFVTQWLETDDYTDQLISRSILFTITGTWNFVHALFYHWQQNIRPLKGNSGSYRKVTVTFN